MNYEVSKMPFLGQGAFGIVYRADDKTALKVVHVGTDTDLKHLVLDEVEFMMKIKRQEGPGSQHIIKITGHDELEDRVYIKMELAQDSLASLMKGDKYTQITLSKKIDVAKQTFAGLEFLHGRSPAVIHQDVKPLNIVIFTDLQVKLTDFGLARSKSSTSVTWGGRNVVGSLQYMAPEVLVGVPGRGKMMGQPCADVWSACCTSMEWLTRCSPWSLKDNEDIADQIKDKQKSRTRPEGLQNVHGKVKQVLEAGLTYDFNMRPTAKNMKECLDKLQLEIPPAELAAVSSSPTSPASSDSGKGDSASASDHVSDSVRRCYYGNMASMSDALKDLSMVLDMPTHSPVKPPLHNVPMEKTKTWPNGDKYIGEMKGDLPHGYGTFMWAAGHNGEKYVGSWLNGKREGTGIHTWPDGKKYVGSYVNDKYEGTGTITWPDGQKYVGNWLNGTREGTGTHTWPNGQKYVGSYVNDKYEGTGTMTWPDVGKYVGSWLNGKREGTGTHTWPDGKKYVGSYVNGKWKGTGTQTWPDGKKYVGSYVNDTYEGTGTMTWPDGQKYVGSWLNGKREGTGTHTWPDGKKYAGSYVNDKWEGTGTMTWPDGQKYVGNWLNDTREGTGTHTWPGGHKYMGSWLNGKRHGYGTMTWAGGRRYEGYWKDDVESKTKV